MAQISSAVLPVGFFSARVGVFGWQWLRRGKGWRISWQRGWIAPGFEDVADQRREEGRVR